MNWARGLAGLGQTEAEIIEGLDDFGGLVHTPTDSRPTIGKWVEGLRANRDARPWFRRTLAAWENFAHFSMAAFMHDLEAAPARWNGGLRIGAGFRSATIQPPPIDLAGSGISAWMERWKNVFPKTYAEYLHQESRTGTGYVSAYTFLQEFLSGPNRYPDGRLNDDVYDDAPPAALPGWAPSEIIVRPADLSILYAEKTRAELESAKDELKKASEETIRTITEEIIPGAKRDQENAFTQKLQSGSTWLLLGGAALLGFLLVRRKM